ncbi:Maf-like protein yhdE [Giardia muris]|uniref:Maf-like protein yhdE n=1 Tax=Giardia muris TaxID=5742 RepID=A0A4Z1TDM4_GIAMU|nr:Maf-like protein yhdE [Giardia muris]|eukprot:TNJ30659.1 Maf-like protein yhdE [Giardia muris]
MHIVLASTSSRRAAILRAAGYTFSTCSPDCQEERATSTSDPEALALSNATRKAEAVLSLQTDPNAVVIGCDTVVLCKGDIYEKPRSRDECTSFISRFSGEQVSVVTAMAIRGARVRDSISKTLFFFRTISQSEITEYTNTSEPYDKAGGLSYQGWASRWITRIEGDYHGAVGLPISILAETLASTSEHK